MKSGSRRLLIVGLAVIASLAAVSCRPSKSDRKGLSPTSADTLRISTVRQAAIRGGLLPAKDLVVGTDPARVAVGKLLFESKAMSLNGSISCRDCHLDEFGSADGLPNAIGVGGSGKGAARMGSGGRILPRNALALWGRGGPGFDTFFWDGKVARVDGVIVSQFGSHPPSEDPLTVAVHLPSVELREMVADTAEVRSSLVNEDVSTASEVQGELARRFATEPSIGPAIAKAYGITPSAISFDQIGDALAQFIRHEFRLRPNRLEKFVFAGGPITDDELAGGLIFYGQGRCIACHNGPYFSDMAFHAVAFPQTGFGKNGFGIDEGRYNVTLNPRDRFLFRTPPLHNVTRTAPYSHSGSVPKLKDAIIAHFDPLRLIDLSKTTLRQRTDLYARLGPASREPLPTALTDEEVDQLAAFLAMLEFNTESISRPTARH